ncbi:MAG: EFR1 family ferrodoxin [Candidatus Odinarchaeota archaeon]
MNNKQAQYQALVLYYTCSQNTAQLAQEAEHVLQKRNWQVFLAPLRQAIKDIPTSRPDLLVVGVPVHYATVPKAAMQMIRRLPRFEDSSAFVFSTYGGDWTKNVPYLLAQELASKGATVVGGAQMLMPHSFRVNGKERLGDRDETFGKGHPDETELTEFRTALQTIANQVENGSPTPIDLNRLKLNTMGTIASVMNAVLSLEMKQQSMPRIHINPGTCTGCKQCGKICDAGSIEYGTNRMVRIHRESCQKCYACIEVCASGTLTTNWKKMERFARLMHPFSRNTISTIIY